jgi:hypothetical protein
MNANHDDEQYHVSQRVFFATLRMPSDVNGLHAIVGYKTREDPQPLILPGAFPKRERRSNRTQLQIGRVLSGQPTVHPELTKDFTASG